MTRRSVLCVMAGITSLIVTVSVAMWSLSDTSPETQPHRAARSLPGEPTAQGERMASGAHLAEDAARERASVDFSDDFNRATLGEGRWLVTRKNDFSQFLVDITPEKGEDGGERLRLRCGTIGTDDQTVKSLGIASRDSVDLSGKKRLVFDLDWNDQSNGCYLTAAIYLCPTLTKGNPADEAQWLRLEYVGVPPGKNARAAIWLKSNRRERWLYDEGWPKQQRTGRMIGKPHVEIHFDDGTWKVLEDGRLLFDSREKWKLSFTHAHIYLQMTSHSNYPPREIFFDNITFGSVKPSTSALERRQAGTTVSR